MYFLTICTTFFFIFFSAFTININFKPLTEITKLTNYGSIFELDEMPTCQLSNFENDYFYFFDSIHKEFIYYDTLGNAYNNALEMNPQWFIVHRWFDIESGAPLIRHCTSPQNNDVFVCYSLLTRGILECDHFIAEENKWYPITLPLFVPFITVFDMLCFSNGDVSIIVSENIGGVLPNRTIAPQFVYFSYNSNGDLIKNVSVIQNALIYNDTFRSISNQAQFTKNNLDQFMISVKVANESDHILNNPKFMVGFYGYYDINLHELIINTSDINNAKPIYTKIPEFVWYYHTIAVNELYFTLYPNAMHGENGSIFRQWQGLFLNIMDSYGNYYQLNQSNNDTTIVDYQYMNHDALNTSLMNPHIIKLDTDSINDELMYFLVIYPLELKIMGDIISINPNDQIINFLEHFSFIDMNDNSNIYKTLQNMCSIQSIATDNNGYRTLFLTFETSDHFFNRTRYAQTFQVVIN